MRDPVAATVDVYRRPGCRVELRNVQPRRRARIGEPPAGPARGGADRDPSSGWQTAAAGDESSRGLDHLLEVFAFDHAVARKHRPIGRMRAGERGVGQAGTCALERYHATVFSRPSARFFLGDFFSRMWLENAGRDLSLPVAVFLKRFFAPEWDFILGMGGRTG